MRHISTPPSQRFVRVRRARLIGDWCIECHRHVDHHALVQIEGDWQSHCDNCACHECGDDDNNTTRRHP